MNDLVTLDPHAVNVTPNNNIAEQIFDPLVRRDAQLRIVPGLAESWHRVDDVTWEFRLRRGVKFHDGSPLTADDVIFSLDRPARMRAPELGVLTYTKAIVGKVAVDRYTVRVKTAAPYAYLVDDLCGVMIVSSKAAANKAESDFDSDAVAVGTGPLRLRRRAHSEQIVLQRNDDYWGAKPAWDTVRFRFIKEDPSRVAALESGQVEVIENVPPESYDRLKGNKDISVFEAKSNRVVHLQLDSARDASPYVTDRAGKPLQRNPLKDPRVRKAISLAIDREAIISHHLYGLGDPAGQMIPDGYFTASPKLKPDRMNRDAAKTLLAEAGYPAGFGLVIHAPRDRLVKGSEVVQAVAQMLARIGIDAKVETMPYVVYIQRARRLEFSAVLQSWSAVNEATIPLRFVALTFDPATGFGGFNFGRYSNPLADKLYGQARGTLDSVKRNALLQRATEAVMQDYGIIPLYFQRNIWAARKPLQYHPRRDERTYASEVHPGHRGPPPESALVR